VYILYIFGVLLEQPWVWAWASTIVQIIKEWMRYGQVGWGGKFERWNLDGLRKLDTMFLEGPPFILVSFSLQNMCWKNCQSSPGFMEHSHSSPPVAEPGDLLLTSNEQHENNLQNTAGFGIFLIFIGPNGLNSDNTESHFSSVCYVGGICIFDDQWASCDL